jgi:hypothetical protein
MEVPNMKDILAAIGAWRLCNMMLDENARLPASARVFRVVMWAGASACVAAVAMLVIGYVLHCYAEWFPSGLPF